LCAGDCFWKTYSSSNQCPQCRARLTSRCHYVVPEEEQCSICREPFPDARSLDTLEGKNCLHRLCYANGCADEVYYRCGNRCPICNAVWE
jgi:hypothetical protein